MSIGSLFVMIQMTGEIKLHGLGSGVHESVHGWLAEGKKPFSKVVTIKSLLPDHQEEKLGHIPNTTVERVSEDTLLVHFQSDVLFDVDSAIVKPQAQDPLDDAAQVFQEYKKTAIIVQGHTDSTGTEEHNQALSERRAQSVVAYLTGKGIDPARMAPQGYGEGQPIADNGTTDGRAKNRRVDLLLKAKAK